MSYNNGSLSTEYIDPSIFVPGQRCVFELDGSKLGYATNMRLLDLGAVSDGAHDYNRLLGCVSLIKNIRLMDGRTELSALRSPAQYLAFKNQSRSNADNKSSASFLKRSELGLEIDVTNKKLNHIYSAGTMNTAVATTTSAYLDLREVFPILNSMPIVPSSMFPNLRIEIEFARNDTNQVSVNQSVATTNAQAPLRPILAVDVVEDDRILVPLVRALKEKGVRWMEIEHDRYNIVGRSLVTPEVAGTVQRRSHQSMGFIGKKVERLLMVKTLTNNDETINTTGQREVMGFGNSGSQALLKQTTQIRLNGKNVFPGFQGISRPMQRLALMSDEYGTQQAYPGSPTYKWSNGNELMQTGANQWDSGKAFGGQLSYDVVRIGARVADLSIQIGREFDADPLGQVGTAPASTNAPITMNMYGEVEKALAVGGAGYRIVYA